MLAKNSGHAGIYFLFLYIFFIYTRYSEMNPGEQKYT